MMKVSTLLSLLVGLEAVCTVGLAFADTQEEQIAKLLKTVYKLEKLVLNQNEKLKHVEALQKRLSKAERRLAAVEDLNVRTGKAGEKCARELNELKNRLVNIEGLWHYFAEDDRQPAHDKETDTKKYKYSFREHMVENGVPEIQQHNDDVNKTRRFLLRKQYVDLPQDFENAANSQERLQIDTHDWTSQQMNVASETTLPGRVTPQDVFKQDGAHIRASAVACSLTKIEISDIMEISESEYTECRANYEINFQRKRAPPKRNRTKLKGLVAGHVAFSAYLSQSLSGLGPNQTIKFDRLDYNEGGAFDTTTGMFSCPASGTYFFTASILSYQGNYVETAIVLNGEEQAIVYAGNPPTSPKYDQGSNSAIVHCDVDQKIWVKLRENYGNAVYGGRYSKFSGYTLW